MCGNAAETFGQDARRFHSLVDWSEDIWRFLIYSVVTSRWKCVSLPVGVISIGDTLLPVRDVSLPAGGVSLPVREVQQLLLASVLSFVTM